MGVSVDVTERKQLEQVLQESNARLTGIVTSAMDAIIAVDEDQHIVVFNAAAEKMFGCPAQRGHWKSCWSFYPATLPGRPSRTYSQVWRDWGYQSLDGYAWRSVGRASEW